MEKSESNWNRYYQVWFGWLVLLTHQSYVFTIVSFSCFPISRVLFVNGNHHTSTSSSLMVYHVVQTDCTYTSRLLQIYHCDMVCGDSFAATNASMEWLLEGWCKARGHRVGERGCDHTLSGPPRLTKERVPHQATSVKGSHRVRQKLHQSPRHQAQHQSPQKGQHSHSQQRGGHHTQLVG